VIPVFTYIYLLKVYVLGRLDVEPRHILVVDDDELVSEYLGALLEAEDYEVMVLNEPVAALEYFKAHPNEFDLIVTDQVMPGLTGVEIAQSILEVRPDIPVLLITGYSEKISAENAKSFGLSGFFPKPINENLFLDKINNLVACVAH
jgi:CheY-like chemotaxis protein